MARRHLAIDADDTLWENNVYFERAFERFVDFLNHSTLAASEIRTIFDAIEIESIKVRGYGAENFSLHLGMCLEQLCERPVTARDIETARSFGLEILEHPIELIDGVADTLEYLRSRGHELILFTKGNPREQQAKVDRSGLHRLFDHAVIVREKDPAAYALLATEKDLDRERSWMVGNSPKSDINPSLAAGWNAAYVPHERTWILEQTEIINPGPGQLIHLERFADLARHF
jgi:putative hydrolase of the HAD superfamily